MKKKKIAFILFYTQFLLLTLQIFFIAFFTNTEIAKNTTKREVNTVSNCEISNLVNLNPLRIFSQI